jgi:hypothetical protein
VGKEAMVVHKIGSYTKDILSLSVLELDPENFRIGQQANQSDVIRTMLTRSSAKVIGIVESIGENGFHDLELPCVFPSKSKGHYVVAEGNRRITALKALHTPTLAEGTPSVQRIKSISKDMNGKLPSKIQCAIFENKKDCLAYVLMRHGFTSDGSGLLPWDSISRRRAQAYINGKVLKELEVLEFVIGNGTLSEGHIGRITDDDFNITNLERLTDDVGARKLLGIDGVDCTNSQKGKQWLLKVWQRVVETILDSKHHGEKFTVDKNINDSNLIFQFLSEVIEDVHGEKLTEKPKSGSAGTGASANPTDQGGKGPTPGPGTKVKKPVKQPTTKERKGLIAKSFGPEHLEPQKTVDIVDELKNLVVADFQNTAGVMFRVFLELSIVHYMKKHKIKQTKPHNKKPALHVDLKLREKISAVVTFLETAGKLDKQIIKPLKDLNSSNHPISAESLNAYVHSSVVTPVANTLKVEWNNLQTVFEALWKK